MMEQFLSWDISHKFITVIIAASPVVELRGALPIAIFYFNMPWYEAFLLSVLGNLLPVPILLLFWEKVAQVASRFKIGEKVVNWVFKNTRRRGKIIEKYERIGLTLFVAIPSPFTGAWTGSIIAFLLGLKFRYAFLSILMGIIIAGAIVTGLCLVGWTGLTTLG